MKMVHVVPHIDQEAAGPSYSVPRLCASLAARGHAVELSCLAARGPIPAVHLDLHPQWNVLGRFAISTSLAFALRAKADHVEVIHNHSLWSMVNVAAGWMVPGRMCKLVCSPRGTLAPWALGRTRILKWLLWPLQRRTLKRADLLHATSELEYREIRAQGLAAPVAIIPNGIDVPEVRRPAREADLRTLLFLSRLHPKKGVDLLLRAWQSLQRDHPGWQLIVAGRGQVAHERELQQMIATLDLERVRMPGPLYGEAKADAYFSAGLFVLPTHSENFGMVVAEALAHGCPVVVSKGAPWSGLEVEGCGWWVPNDVESLTRALDAAMKLPTVQLRAMGARGRAWMVRDFSWASIAERMEAAYLGLVSGRWPDGLVRID